jgi:methionyl-tRNA formyltransferase
MIKNALRVIFAGTPEFSAVILKSILDAKHDVVAVLTQPDRPSGRGRQLTASPVKNIALERKIKIEQPDRLGADEFKIIEAFKADIMVVAAYGLIVPEFTLSLPRWGCFNIHTSLLPRWRGAAPIQRAILAGDAVTGISIMQMDKGLDTGPILLKKECSIENNDTSVSLHDRLATLGSIAILEVLDKLSNHPDSDLHPQPQDDSKATYAHKIKKEEAILDWNTTAEDLDRKIRAFNPWPIAQTTLQNKIIRVWQATVQPSTSQNKPGAIVKVSPAGIDIATGKNILRLQKIQFPGGKVLAVSDILNSRQLDFAVGTILG